VVVLSGGIATELDRRIAAALKATAGSIGRLGGYYEWHTVGKEKQPYYFYTPRRSGDHSCGAVGRVAQS
jgi:hypothetical protein